MGVKPENRGLPDIKTDGYALFKSCLHFPGKNAFDLQTDQQVRAGIPNDKIGKLGLFRIRPAGLKQQDAGQKKN